LTSLDHANKIRIAVRRHRSRLCEPALKWNAGVA